MRAATKNVHAIAKLSDKTPEKAKRFHMLQQRSEIPHAATKSLHAIAKRSNWQNPRKS